MGVSLPDFKKKIIVEERKIVSRSRKKVNSKRGMSDETTFRTVNNFVFLQRLR